MGQTAVALCCNAILVNLGCRHAPTRAPAWFGWGLRGTHRGNRSGDREDASSPVGPARCMGLQYERIPSHQLSMENH